VRTCVESDLLSDDKSTGCVHAQIVQGVHISQEHVHSIANCLLVILRAFPIRFGNSFMQNDQVHLVFILTCMHSNIRYVRKMTNRRFCARKRNSECVARFLHSQYRDQNHRLGAPPAQSAHARIPSTCHRKANRILHTYAHR